MTDYYAMLEVIPSASDEVIKSAYKVLGKKYHPDNQKYPTEICQKKMIEINVAYAVLSDPVKRKQYDYEYQQYMKDKSSETYINSKDKDEEKTSQTEIYNVDEFEGVFQSFFRGVGSMVQKNKQIVENAYIEGTGMDDYELVRAYMKNYGLKRQGFSIVMEERELLIRNQDGKLVPTDKFRVYWR